MKKINLTQLRNKNISIAGMLIACGILFGYVEYLIPLPIGIPGVKVGLANIITVVSLYLLGPSLSLVVLLLRVFLSGILFGNFFGIVYGLSGAVTAFIAMQIGKKAGIFSVIGVSIWGGVMHNVAQLIVACFLVSQIKLSFYLPVLLLSGLICGAIVGIISLEVLNRLKSFRKDL